MDCLLECNCLLKMISHVLALAFLSKCHIVTTKKIELKKINCNCWHHSQLHLRAGLDLESRLKNGLG